MAVFRDEYPNIALELGPTGWDQIENLTREDADVVAGDARILGQLRAQGDLLDLAPFLEHDSSLDVNDFHPGVLEALTHESRV